MSPAGRMRSGRQVCDNIRMPWLLYLFGSGQALFLGAGMILAAIGLLPRFPTGWKGAAIAMVARLGLVLAIASAVPLSYWLYAVAIGMTGVWLWRERRSPGEREASASRSRKSAGAPEAAHRGAHAPRSPLRWATGAIWLGIMLLEFPYQLSPRLPRLGNPPLFIIGDSVTAGAGAGEKHVWPDLLPKSIDVHNLAKPGATTAMALRSQANQLPAEGGLVLVEIGGNDLLGEMSLAQFEQDLDALLQQVCRSAGASPSRRTVVMFELPLPPLCNEYGRIQRRLAARYGVYLIPKRVFISVLADGGATLDTIHLSPAGHQKMAVAVWAVLAPAYH